MVTTTTATTARDKSCDRNSNKFSEMEKLLSLAVVAVVVVTIYAQTVPSKPSCGPHQIYLKCGSACPEHCHQDSIISCIKPCVRGCFCRDGFVLTTVDSNICTPKRLCSLIPKCGLNKEYRVCGSACPNYCGHKGLPCIRNCKDKEQPCQALCVHGCFCKTGFILKQKNSTECILENACPLP